MMTTTPPLSKQHTTAAQWTKRNLQNTNEATYNGNQTTPTIGITQS